MKEKVLEIGQEKNECRDERMSSGAGRIDLHRQRGLQTPTSSLGERFWSFGLGGKRSFWQSPVWFWWESITNPSLHTRTHAFSPSAWSTNSYQQSQDCYPPILSFLAFTHQRQQAKGEEEGIFSSSLISLSWLLGVRLLLLLQLSDLPKLLFFHLVYTLNPLCLTEGIKWTCWQGQGTSSSQAHTCIELARTVKRRAHPQHPPSRLSTNLDMPKSR